MYACESRFRLVQVPLIPRGNSAMEGEEWARELGCIKTLRHTSRLAAKTTFHNGGIILKNSSFPPLSFFITLGPAFRYNAGHSVQVTVRSPVATEGKCQRSTRHFRVGNSRAWRCFNPGEKFASLWRENRETLLEPARGRSRDELLAKLGSGTGDSRLSDFLFFSFYYHYYYFFIISFPRFTRIEGAS